MEDISLNQLLRSTVYQWHGVRLNQPDWSESSRALAFTVLLKQGQVRVHGMMNAYWEALDFELPAHGEKPWKRWIDTALPSPDDIVDYAGAPVLTGTSYLVQPRSIVFIAEQLPG